MLAKDSERFILPAAAAAAVAWLVASWYYASARPLAWLLTLFAVFTLFFFRDPEREIPKTKGMLSIADGYVSGVDGEKITIFLGLHNNHVNRSPVSGKVLSIRRGGSRFLPAFMKASEHNVWEEMAIKTPKGNVRFTRSVGLLARRIITWVSEGDTISSGQRIGMLAFGSRCDVYFGKLKPKVKKGDVLRAGQTVIAS